MSNENPGKLWRWLWPKVDDLASAKLASQIGLWGAATISTLTVAAVCISSASQRYKLEGEVWSYIGSAIWMAVVAWRIKHYSRFFAVTGATVFIFEKLFLTPGYIGMALPLSLLFSPRSERRICLQPIQAHEHMGRVSRVMETKRGGCNDLNVCGFNNSAPF